MGEFAYTHTMIFTFIYFFLFFNFFFESKKIRLDAQSARCSPLVRTTTTKSPKKYTEQTRKKNFAIKLFSSG